MQGLFQLLLMNILNEDALPTLNSLITLLEHCIEQELLNISKLILK